MPLSNKFYNQSWFYWLVLAIVTVGLGWFFYTQFYVEPVDWSDGGDQKANIQVIDNKDGTKTVKNVGEGYEVKVPDLFNNQPSNDLDFYTSDSDCKLSFNIIDKNRAKSLVELIEKDSEQLTYMTVIQRDVKYLNDEKTRAIYTLETGETGLSKIYYEDIGNQYIQIYIYSGDSRDNCYKQIEQLEINR